MNNLCLSISLRLQNVSIVFVLAWFTAYRWTDPSHCLLADNCFFSLVRENWYRNIFVIFQKKLYGLWSLTN